MSKINNGTNKNKINKKVKNNFLQQIQKVHFIGIGGSGMIGLVQILHQLGLKITGSDLNYSDPVKLAQKLGIEVSLKQVKENIKKPDLIVYTSAILSNNPELQQAKQSKIPLMERSELLAALTSCYSNCVSVSGTHGKTTTTAMVAEILNLGFKNLSIVIGGNLKSFDGYGKVSEADLIVCEACEFANHFLKLQTTHGVVLNIEADHMDFFKNIDNLKNSFKKFCEKTSKCLVYCGDDENVVNVVNSINFNNKKKISFGLSEKNDFFAINIKKVAADCFKFNVVCFNKILNQTFKIFIPGKHNVVNALAAIAVGHSFGLNFDIIAAGLENFKGVKRRFEVIGKVNGITVVDDYAHHPSEIKAVLKAAKEFGFKKIWAIHQPFTYSRTQMFLNAFADALKIADRVVLTKILGSREENLTGITSQHLAAKIENSVVFETQNDAAKFVLKNAQPGDLAITLGCGDIYKCAKIMVYGAY